MSTQTHKRAHIGTHNIDITHTRCALLVSRYQLLSLCLFAGKTVSAANLVRSRGGDIDQWYAGHVTENLSRRASESDLFDPAALEKCSDNHMHVERGVEMFADTHRGVDGGD